MASRAGLPRKKAFGRANVSSRGTRVRCREVGQMANRSNWAVVDAAREVDMHAVANSRQVATQWRICTERALPVQVAIGLDHRG